MRSVRQIVAVAAALVIAAAQVTGCTTGEDAVAQGGTFDFVSPGGQTAIFYDPPSSRVTIGDLNGPDLFTDETIWLSDFTGKVVLINVWGSWCGPCREKMPDLQFVQDQTADVGAVVLGLDVRDSRDNAADFMRNRGLTYDSIFDSPGRTLAQLDGVPRNVVPLTLVLDEQHRVAWVTLLPIRPSELISVVEDLAAEPAPAPPPP